MDLKLTHYRIVGRLEQEVRVVYISACTGRDCIFSRGNPIPKTVGNRAQAAKR